MGFITTYDKIKWVTVILLSFSRKGKMELRCHKILMPYVKCCDIIGRQTIISWRYILYITKQPPKCQRMFLNAVFFSLVPNTPCYVPYQYQCSFSPRPSLWPSNMLPLLPYSLILLHFKICFQTRQSEILFIKGYLEGSKELHMDICCKRRWTSEVLTSPTV